jgi:hypothetical protein
LPVRALCAIALALVLAACGGRPDVVADKDGGFRATGWRGAEPVAGWSSVFAVYAGGPDAQPMLGDYRRSGSTIRFTPRFTPSPGVELRLVYRAPGGLIERSLRIPGAVAAAAPAVVAISPASDVLPENLLKLYVEFSEPMARGQAYQQLRIVDDAGQVVADPFVEIDQELWDPAGKRLTILFDPGRIKRGVKPNEDVGAPLKVGRSYRLIVAKGWRSAAGAALPADAIKKFSVGPSERRPILLSEWKIAAPTAGSREPLTVRFPRPLDDAILAHALHVQQKGEGIVGTVRVTDQARSWTFTPKSAWRDGAYELLVETSLEDLAGNRIGRAFDVDTVGAPQPRITRASETLTFQVKG